MALKAPAPRSAAAAVACLQLWALTLAATGWSPDAQASGSGPSRPNVLLIQADDLGYGDLGAYGQRHFATPALDRLAAEGVRFTQYYAGSTVCAPSRAALMTGLHTGHGWIRGNGEIPLRPGDVTVAMLLRAAGYRTAVIGKWGLGLPGTTGEPRAKGFEYSFGFLDHRHAHRQFTDHLYRDGRRVDVDDGDYVNDLFTREAESFIGQPDERPFFLYLNYTVPHAELRVPEADAARFDGRFAEEPFRNPAADAQTAFTGESLGYRSQPRPKAAFAAMIARLDRDVGRLLDALRARGIERRTLVLFTSDNGPHTEGGADPAFFGSAGGLRGIKRDLYEGGVRVPMIARWPDVVSAGRTSDHAWAHWDVLPTLAELAGAAVPEGIDGRSMAGVLRGDSAPAHASLYWEFHERGFQQALRAGRWKAVRLKAGASIELYDLERDPGEQHDVAAEHPVVAADLDARLRAARTESPLWPTDPAVPRDPEILYLEHAWNEAHLRRDAAALDAIWAEPFVVTLPGMPPMDRDAALAVVRSGRVTFERYQTSDLRLRTLGHTAIVTGRLERSRRGPDGTVEDAWQFTKTYVRRDGRWRVIAFHASPAPLAQ